MEIKEITFALKRGLPNYSSVSAGITATVREGEDTGKAWDELKREVIKQCNTDEDWMNTKQSNEGGEKHG